MSGLGQFARVFALLIGIWCQFALAHTAWAGRVALVIGNSEYEHTVPLANPRNDAEAISVALGKLGFTVFDGFDLSRSDTEDLIRRFARAATDADAAMLYYAGHGLEVGGANYLVPIDARISDEADLKFETINLTDILALMEREQRTNLIFLDACRDNPMATHLARNMGTRSAAIGRGLARIDTGVGTLIAYATQPGNVALDGIGRHSPFTRALLEHIDTPELDVELMMRRVRRDVMEKTGGQQVPWSSSSLTGSFIFQMQTHAPLVGTPPATPSTDVLAALVPPAVQPATPLGRTDSAPVDSPVALAPVAIPEQSGPDPVPLTGELSKEALARQSQAALNRLGCNAGVEDGIWGRKSRRALERLAEHAPSVELASLDPSEDLLRQMQKLDGQICPLVCAATENLIEGACVTITCPSGQRLNSNGVCFSPRATTNRKSTSSRSGSSRSSSSCFSFNGQTFCQ